MKRLFSKKSGFTVVEIVMAFLIFAIMAGMILAVLRLAVEQRKTNKEIADDLDAQTELLVAKDKSKTSSAYNDGTIVVKSNGKELASIDYARADVTDGITDAQTDMTINYYIGEYNNNKGSELSTPDIPGNGKAVNKRVDARIYGTADFENIKIYNVARDLTYDGDGVRYLFEVSAKALGSVDPEKADYMQYYISFPNTKAKEAGYFWDSQKKMKPTNIESERKYNYSSYEQNPFRVQAIQGSDCTSILISQRKSDDDKYKFDAGGSKHTYFYVVFEKDPGILPINPNYYDLTKNPEYPSYPHTDDVELILKGLLPPDTDPKMTAEERRNAYFSDTANYPNSTVSISNTADKLEYFSYFGDNGAVDGVGIIFTTDSADELVNKNKKPSEEIRCTNIYGVKESSVEVNPGTEEPTETTE